jgi:hypothetical protein
LIENELIDRAEFLLGDFRGVDTLMMEYLKTKTSKVTVLHIGEKPRYAPDRYKTKVSSWTFVGGFQDDQSRDEEAIKNCTHYLAIDRNSNDSRKSGTMRNLERCEALGKIALGF